MTSVLLDVRSVVKQFGGLIAVNNVSFQVERGEFLGIAGPNGSGKSTLFNLVTGIPFRPTDGEIWFEGARIDSLAPHRIAGRGLARTFQKDADFPELSARATVMLSAIYGGSLSSHRARQETEAVLDQVFFDEARRDLPSSGLSVYEKKQLMIASALVMRPKLLMLDEPAAGLTKPEIVALDALLISINRSGVAILLIEHVLGLLLSVVTRLIVLNQGSLLAEGNPHAVMKQPAVVEAYLGARAA